MHVYSLLPIQIQINDFYKVNDALWWLTCFDVLDIWTQHACTHIKHMHLKQKCTRSYEHDHMWSFLDQPDDYNYWSSNLALGKPTRQSSIYNNARPSRAVDGNRNSNFHASSCTHTQNAKGNWWQVDLEAVYEIRDVVITNRGDDAGKLNQTQSRRVNATLLVNIKTLAIHYKLKEKYVVTSGSTEKGFSNVNENRSRCVNTKEFIYVIHREEIAWLMGFHKSTLVARGAYTLRP